MDLTLPPDVKYSSNTKDRIIASAFIEQTASKIRFQSNASASPTQMQ